MSDPTTQWWVERHIDQEHMIWIEDPSNSGSEKLPVHVAPAFNRWSGYKIRRSSISRQHRFTVEYHINASSGQLRTIARQFRLDKETADITIGQLHRGFQVISILYSYTKSYGQLRRRWDGIASCKRHPFPVKYGHIFETVRRKQLGRVHYWWVILLSLSPVTDFLFACR